MPDLRLSHVRVPWNLPLDGHLLSMARLAWMWMRQPCARVVLRGDEPFSRVLLLHRLGPSGVIGITDRLDGRSVRGALGGPRVGVCSGSSSKCPRATSPCPAVSSSDEHIESIDLTQRS
jgi:hypothetical protein